MLEVTFYIGDDGLKTTLNFESVVRRSIPGVTLEKLETIGTELHYKATTTQPTDLMALGAAIFIHNDELNHYYKRPAEIKA